MSDRLTFQREDNGGWRATWDGRYRAVGWNKDLAVRRLAAFVSDAQADVWHGSGLKERVSEYFRPLTQKEPDQ